MDDEEEDGSGYKMAQGPQVCVVKEPMTDSEDSTEPAESSNDSEQYWLDVTKRTEVSSEFWQIQKLVKYMKTGNQTATNVSLCLLQDTDLDSEINQLAIQEIGGLEVLVNILETVELRCQIGALTILNIIAKNLEIRRNMTDLGTVPILIKLLSCPAQDIQILAAETLAKVCRVRKARKIVRKCGGIPTVVDLLDINQKYLSTDIKQLTDKEKEWVDLAQAGAQALWSLCESKRNMETMRKCGVVMLLARLLRSVHQNVVIPTMATVATCAIDPGYRLAIQTEGMVPDIVRHLESNSVELKTHCAMAIFRCSENTETRDQVRQAGGLDPLVMLAKDSKLRENKSLLAAVTGAIWKCAISSENVTRFDQLGTVPVLVALLADDNENILTNVVGALAECLKFPHNREVLKRAKGIQLLVGLLNGTHAPLLENVPLVLRECAQDPDSMEIIDELDAVRLIWSLLKNPSPRVQANAAWALCPCVENAKESGEMVRSLVGGLELIVSLLRSTDTKVLAAVCAALAVISKDRENLAVITDHGVIPMLAKLVDTEDELLREHLAAAIANSCAWGTNCKQLGRKGAITPLVGYMAGSNTRVHRTAALALHALSANAFNCITMHESGVVTFLLNAVASTDEILQEAAAGCLRNIRKLALEAETFHLLGEETSQNEEDEDVFKK